MRQTNGSSQEMSGTFYQVSTISRDNGFQMEGYWIWCPSIAYAEGKFHMFASRWPKNLSFHPGWVFRSEVVRATADRIEGPYTFAEVVLPARGPEYWDGCATHNPTIREFNNRFYLFYAGSTHPYGKITERSQISDDRYLVARGNKRIGVAWADSIEGPWNRFDLPVLSTKPDTFYSGLTSNPAPVIDQNGEVTMLFKCRLWREYEFSGQQLALAKAPCPEGPYEIVGTKPLFTDQNEGLEDPFLWHDGRHFQMIVKKMRGRTESENGELICAYSDDAQRWIESSPAIALRREIRWSDGSLERFAHMERPFGFVQGDQITHLCVAVCNGVYGFGRVTEARNIVLPVKAISGINRRLEAAMTVHSKCGIHQAIAGSR